MPGDPAAVGHAGGGGRHLLITMPKLPRLTLPVLSDLAGQLRFAPSEVARRAIERTETLAGEIDPGASYPTEWIIFRITRYRPDSGSGEPTVVAGRELLKELSAFAEHLCHAAGLRESDVLRDDGSGAEHAFLTPDELAERWRVSRKTIDRCRREGLVARRVIDGRGKARLFISVAGAEAFRARQGVKLERAASFSRMDEKARASMVRRAARYRRRFGCSLNQIAARLAPRFGRSQEAVRQVLRKADRTSGSGRRTRGAGDVAVAGDAGVGGASDALAFNGEHSITERERRLAYRAWKRAIEPSEVASRLGHRKPAILRAILLERLGGLRELGPMLGHHTGPTFSASGAEKTILASPAVRSGLGAPGASTLAELLQAARARTVPIGAEESARGVAYHFLLWRCTERIEKVSHLQPSASALDAIETDLRWAARLKAELIRSQLPLMVQTIEGRLEAPLGTLRPADAVQIVLAGLSVIAEAVHAHDPIRAATTGARLAGSIGPALTRLAAQWSKRLEASAVKSRATAVYTGRVAIADWTVSCAPWQAMVEPRAAVRVSLGQLPPEDAAFLGERFGWSGGPPATLRELASRYKLTSMHVAAKERKILRAAFAAARAFGGGRVE
ncbi:MAG: hypothetical protein GIKADHBN_01187 [Phycisphaerales bacterium]|nr:hypothetical protein [Phycisphaerales bacterium]